MKNVNFKHNPLRLKKMKVKKFIEDLIDDHTYGRVELCFVSGDVLWAKLKNNGSENTQLIKF